MKILNVPEDTFTVTSGKYAVVTGTEYNAIDTKTYPSATNTSEYFISDLCKVYSNYYNVASTNINNNYYTVDLIYDTKDVYMMSTTDYIPNQNQNWMYPLNNELRYLQTINYPITRTISIILNSNTLPVYNLENDITFTVKLLGKQETMTIPSGDHTYSSVNKIFEDKMHEGFSGWLMVHNYNDILYFDYTRLIPESTGSIIVPDNANLIKYYGLLHMVYPNNTDIDTTKSYRKFSTNMAPVYRSLHIPSGKYSAEYLVDYINDHSSNMYTVNGYNSLSYTQFLAKIEDNDIIIYTNDGTEFFINPICPLNSYKESNWSSQHRLIHLEDGYDIEPYYITTQIIDVTPSGNYSNFSVTGLPDWLTFNSETGNIYGVVPNGVEGQFTVSVTSSDFIGSITLVFNILKMMKIFVVNNSFEYI